MSERIPLSSPIRYDNPGTLPKPGAIGRIVRFSMGLLCLWVTWELATNSSEMDLINPSWWFLLGIALLLVTYVVNIGFGLSVGTWPRNLSIALIATSAIAAHLIGGSFLGTPLWLAGTFWMVYIYGHLGVSFLVSTIIATPGCEMRALPHLLGLASGHKVAEHYCPAFIDNIDKWEHARNAGIDVDERYSAEGPGAKDLLRNPGRMLVIYGIPFAAIQFAGNFGGFTIATMVPAVSLLAISLVCFINIFRCRRVHCYFLGPWLLVAGVVLALYSFRLINFGPSTWSLVVNIALVGGVCISMHVEMAWGRYFPNK
ncbi:MAG: hypothetical protein O2971_09635 [Proteobacteria bacterium]|nr:hypothetical protein [Pseudomonadota bacterium]